MRHAFTLSVLLLPLAGLSQAAQARDAPPALFAAANAVDAAALDEARGGFITADGLTVTLGLERLVTINGNVVERTELQLGDIGKLASGQASVSSETLGQLRLIQNGEVRAITPDSTTLLGGTIIQNSLNDQLIKSQTAINATVNSAGMLRALNFGASLNNALSTALGPR
ncbi:hypothetical protein [Massilia sp. Se16.2.3]|uniref:hypothetical protein n=1 Tax=Massilia sp. Se16.2.3 TaxID=2709303 RepID=UPI0016043996|nr:hypothetical protein [Massilia sp. Se16.2.3]QNB00410.1 hypothetical protein G4G31_18995 [Massilia sp. Se16.2.3]